MMNIGQRHLRHINMPQRLNRFAFSITENGKQQDRCNLIATPSVQRSLYLNEVTNDFENTIVELPEGVDGQT